MNRLLQDSLPVQTEGAKAEAAESSSTRRVPVVLSVAGYDPSGGAGVLADLKTFAALGVYGMGCITALTVQSTQSVRRVEWVEPDVVVETLDCLAEDVCFSAIKVGMLGQQSVAEAVLAWLKGRPGVPVVLDPLAKSSSGKDLVDEAVRRSLGQGWLARADWITPNLMELEDLTGLAGLSGRLEIENGARWLLRLGTERGNGGLKIVVTGGHAEKPDDLLLTARDCRWYAGEAIPTRSTHGTGCSFSSALAARVALGDDDLAAVLAAKEYVAGGLREAYAVGQGRGPIDHFWRPGK